MPLITLLPSKTSLVLLLLRFSPRLLLATYTCHGIELSRGISPNDCQMALHNFKQHHARLDPDNGYAFMRRTASAFSRHFSHELSLPQAFGYQTCSIGLDIADPAFSMVLVRWGDVIRHWNGLVEHCVGASWPGGRGRGAGGLGKVYGLAFVSSNPATGPAADAATEGVCAKGNLAW